MKGRGKAMSRGAALQGLCHTGIDAGVLRAMKQLARREMSVVAVRALLARATVRHAAMDEAASDEVIARLTRMGALSDERAARGFVRTTTARQGVAKAYLQGRLEELGISERVARRAVREEAPSHDDRAEARRACAAALKRISVKLTREDAMRRLAGVLARRGFEAEVCEEVAGEMVRGWREKS